MRTLIAIALCLSPVAAFAAAQDPDPAKTPPAAAPEKKVCRRMDTEIGSMMVKRVCKTPTEWQAEDMAAAAAKKYNAAPAGMERDATPGP